jgi:hypothetical protein
MGTSLIRRSVAIFRSVDPLTERTDAMTFAVPVRAKAPDDEWDFWKRYRNRSPSVDVWME